MRLRLLTILCCMSFSLMTSAQASGGQIRRPVKKQSTSRQRNDLNSSTSSTVNNNNNVDLRDNNEPPQWTPPREEDDKSNSSKKQIVMPMFPGGSSGLFQYLSQNVHYPERCEKNGIQGRVVVNVIVEANGSIYEAWVENSVDPDLDKEAIRVVKNMPKWIPGNDNGNPIRVKYTIPITFRL